jgi:hypothetical protein
MLPDALEGPVRYIGWLRKDVHESATGITDVQLARHSIRAMDGLSRRIE